MTNQEIIEVVLAAERGESIQSQPIGAMAGYWLHDPNPAWNFEQRNYRVKPKPLVVWCNVYKDGFTEWSTEAAARKAAKPNAIRVAVRMVETPE